MRRLLIIVAILGFLTGSALAGAPKGALGTQQITFNALRSGGVLVGCELDFDQTLLDSSQPSHPLVLIRGALGLVSSHRLALDLILQVRTYDVSIAAGVPRPREFNPHMAYATIEGVSTAGKESQVGKCREGNGFCAHITSLPLFLALTKMHNSFHVAYQRNRDTIDVDTLITLPRPGQTDWPAFSSFRACLEPVLQHALAASPE
jgi:hypothetical protein